jgi:hypothetical protein
MAWDVPQRDATQGNSGGRSSFDQAFRRRVADKRELNLDNAEEGLSLPLKPQSRRAIIAASREENAGLRHILDVESITGATAVGTLLQRHGYKILSAQVAPSSCPVQQEVKSRDDCGPIPQPAAPTFRGASSRMRFQNRADRCKQKKGKRR